MRAPKADKLHAAQTAGDAQLEEAARAEAARIYRQAQASANAAYLAAMASAAAVYQQAVAEADYQLALDPYYDRYGAVQTAQSARDVTEQAAKNGFNLAIGQAEAARQAKLTQAEGYAAAQRGHDQVWMAARSEAQRVYTQDESTTYWDLAIDLATADNDWQTIAAAGPGVQGAIDDTPWGALASALAQAGQARAATLGTADLTRQTSVANAQKVHDSAVAAADAVYARASDVTVAVTGPAGTVTPPTLATLPAVEPGQAPTGSDASFTAPAVVESDYHGLVTAAPIDTPRSLYYYYYAVMHVGTYGEWLWTAGLPYANHAEQLILRPTSTADETRLPAATPQTIDKKVLPNGDVQTETRDAATGRFEITVAPNVGEEAGAAETPSGGGRAGDRPFNETLFESFVRALSPKAYCFWFASGATRVRLDRRDTTSILNFWRFNGDYSWEDTVSGMKFYRFQVDRNLNEYDAAKAAVDLLPEDEDTLWEYAAMRAVRDPNNMVEIMRDAYQRAIQHAADNSMLIAELYAANIFTLTPGGDAVFTLQDIGKNGFHWSHIFAALPVAGMVFHNWPELAVKLSNNRVVRISSKAFERFSEETQGLIRRILDDTTGSLLKKPANVSLEERQAEFLAKVSKLSPDLPETQTVAAIEHLAENAEADVAAATRAARKAANAAASTAKGLARERKVAELVGGVVSREKVVIKGLGSTDIDVIGKARELIGVGGPAKAANLSAFGRQLQILKAAAQERGVAALMYLEEGTPEAAINLAKRWLGDANVVIFRM